MGLTHLHGKKVALKFLRSSRGVWVSPKQFPDDFSFASAPPQVFVNCPSTNSIEIGLNIICDDIKQNESELANKDTAKQS